MQANNTQRLLIINEITKSADHTIDHIFMSQNIDKGCQNSDMKMRTIMSSDIAYTK